MPVIEAGQLVAGRYRLLDTIGSGAMGVVWRARDERLERVIAIKRLIIRPGLSSAQTDEARRRAMREARIAARLQHRNAIAMLDVAEHDGDPCLVMEFLPSRSLSAVIAEQGTLPPEQVAAIGSQVAAALAAAHAAGIVHRDVKPGNILLDDKGTVKITDFGISRAIDDGTITETGMLAGTPAYLAPEIARGQDPGHASDVFSLGATLYHAVEGKPPFGLNPNPLALLHAVASGNVTPPRNAGPITPALMSLLRADPADRPTMDEAASILAQPTAPMPMPVFEQRTVPGRAAVTPTLQAARPRAASATVPHRTAAPAPVKAPAPRRGPLLAALAGVLVLAAAVTLVIANAGERPGAQQPNTVTSVVTVSQEPEASRQSVTAPAPAATEKVTVYSEAGLHVVRYYGSDQSPEQRWELLGPNGKAVFGDFAGFAAYWGQYDYISSRNANGVTPNPDGSVNVPLDVTVKSAAGEVTGKKTVKVIRVGGQYFIDSDSR
ncbi:serine/threonine-protein kinase [Actinokineospora iranica]|uniref:non-specific serine/threonine protein kinase n=1 Tax=Actinokineospora iranica TaxID=1271860 RepID=A0A1G6W656_9PSEU|nr:serine/threonine-protein kinase [Actinokineospora iranica]SDD61362.1 Serine/threonine protein kinase [Actinokineospora iranica]